MKIFTTRSALSLYLTQFKQNNQLIGFVPTMGALHKGHLSLIKRAKKETKVVVCSIFVNPTQFTDPADLEKYPRPIEADIDCLKQANCDILFLPEVAEIYNNTQTWHINLDGLDERLEGKIRPGHYQGVTQIVKMLLDIITPDYAFFGQKDYQQVLVIDKMVKKLGIPIALVMCPTVRETDGLAMSSRNIHLKAKERKNALALFKALNQVKLEFSDKSIQEVTYDAIKYLEGSPGVELEYFQLCDAQTLLPALTKNTKLVALVAARVGQTRLIDNVIL